MFLMNKKKLKISLFNNIHVCQNLLVIACPGFFGGFFILYNKSKYSIGPYQIFCLQFQVRFQL